MNEIVFNILYILITIAATIISAVVVRYINAKTGSQYKDEIDTAAIAAVACVQQTFVDKMKADGKFDINQQSLARSYAVDNILASLTPAALNYLRRRRTDGEVHEYLVTLIEEAVRLQKKEAMNNGS